MTANDRPEREAQRNVELMQLTGRLAMSAMAGLFPLPLLAAGWPPVAIKYRVLASLGAREKRGVKRPSLQVLVLVDPFLEIERL